MLKLINSIFLPFFAIVFFTSLDAAGKIDAGPVYINVDVIDNGSVVDSLDLWGVRADNTGQIIHGLVYKFGISFAGGDGDYLFLSGGLGYYIPICKGWVLIPHAGISYSHLKYPIDIPAFALYHVSQKFTSHTPYIGFDLSYEITPCWIVTGSFLYGFSQTKTKTGDLFTFKGESKGPSYALMVEYCMTQCASVHIAGAYNLTRSKEKHGIKGAGVRIGMGYRY